jgi:hypothetical protein
MDEVLKVVHDPDLVQGLAKKAGAVEARLVPRNRKGAGARLVRLRSLP